MKKLILSIIILLNIFAVSVSGATVDFTIGSSLVNCLDNGVSVKDTDVLPVFIDGECLLPVRIATETLGAAVSWDGNQRKVTISTDNKKISFVIGESNIIVNRDIVQLDNPTVIIDDRTMVPVQFFEKCMGYFVRKVDVAGQFILTNDFPVMRIGDSYLYYDELKLLFDADKDKYSDEVELLVKSCISNLYDTTIMCNNADVNEKNFTDEEKSEILLKAEEDERLYKNISLKSIYLHILSNRKIADKFSDRLSTESIPDDEEILAYAKENYPENHLTDELYEEIRYLLGYEKFVENWNKLYETTDDEMFYDTSKLTEMLK